LNDDSIKDRWLLSEEGLNRWAKIRRFIVVILLADLIIMVWFGRVITGNPLDGFYWPYPNKILFPIPMDFGSMIPVFSPLNPVDAFVYTIFIYGGLWILWLLVGILYVVYPFIEPLRTRVESLKKR